MMTCLCTRCHAELGLCRECGSLLFHAPGCARWLPCVNCGYRGGEAPNPLVAQTERVQRHIAEVREALNRLDVELKVLASVAIEAEGKAK